MQKKRFGIFLSFIFLLALFSSCDPNKIRGEFINNSGGRYKSFNFKTKKSVVVTDAVLGIPSTTTYERKGQAVTIHLDKGDLNLVLKNRNTLIGEGFINDVYIKKE